jgi:SAM-dependent methyltransferase
MTDVRRTPSKDAARLGEPSYVWRSGQERRLQLIRRYVELEDRWILDVGCGIGTYVRRFRDFSPHVFGLDVSVDRSGGMDARPWPSAAYI